MTWEIAAAVPAIPPFLVGSRCVPRLREASLWPSRGPCISRRRVCSSAVARRGQLLPVALRFLLSRSLGCAPPPLASSLSHLVGIPRSPCVGGHGDPIDHRGGGRRGGSLCGGAGGSASPPRGRGDPPCGSVGAVSSVCVSHERRGGGVWGGGGAVPDMRRGWRVHRRGPRRGPAGGGRRVRPL